MGPLMQPGRKAYLIGMIWADQSEPAEYHRKSAPLLARHGGRYLILGGNPSVAGGEEGPKSILVVEFPSREAAKSFYNDPEYASLRLESGQAESDLKVVLADGLG